MSKTKIIIVSLFLFFSVGGNSQTMDFNNYKRLKCEGIVPKDFTTLASDKYKQSKNEISDTASTKDKKIEEDFLHYSTYDLDELLLSGQVLFGDTVTEYLNHVLDNILWNNKPLRDSIRVYTLRTDEVNAFTTNQGIILVTMGLVSQVDNEAQLAFVLCHEIQHFTHHHPLEGYKKSNQIENGEGDYKYLNHKQSILQMFKYSKEMEMTADLRGLDLFKTTKYSYAGAAGIFDVLQYSDLPFDEIDFDSMFFAQKEYKFPKKYRDHDPTPITDDDEVDDDYATHPNLKKRRSVILDKIDVLSDSSRNAFLQPKENFYHIRKICRFETALMQLNNLQYEDAIYSAYLLLKGDSNSVYLKKIIVKSLYGLAMYNNENNYSYYYKDYYGNSKGNHGGMPGSIQQVYFLLKSMDNKEVDILALKSIKDLQQYLPSDKELPGMEKHLLTALVKDYFLKPDDFFKSYEEGKDTSKLDSAQVAFNYDQSKYIKIKKKMEQEQGETHSNYYKYAFVQTFKQYPHFKITWDSIAAQLDSAETKDNLKELVAKGKEEDINFKKGYALGIDTFVIVNPTYSVSDGGGYYYYSYNNETDYEASEAGKIKMNEVLKELSNKLGVTYFVLDNKSMDSSKVEMFNDINTLNEWADEKSAFDDTSYIASNDEDYQSIADKYHSHYFVWNTIDVYRNKHYISAAGWVASVIFFPTLPFVIYAKLHPSYSTNISTKIIDGKTGNIVMDDETTVRMKDTKALLKSQMYYLLQQIKNKREVKPEKEKKGDKK